MKTGRKRQGLRGRCVESVTNLVPRGLAAGNFASLRALLCKGSRLRMAAFRLAAIDVCKMNHEIACKCILDKSTSNVASGNFKALYILIGQH